MCDESVFCISVRAIQNNFSSSLMQDLVVKEFSEGISDPKKRKIFLDLYFTQMTIQQQEQVKKFLPYLIVGIFLWDFTHQSGVHATIAGVILALTIPHNTKNNKESLLLKLESKYVCIITVCHGTTKI